MFTSLLPLLNEWMVISLFYMQCSYVDVNLTLFIVDTFFSLSWGGFIAFGIIVPFVTLWVFYCKILNVTYEILFHVVYVTYVTFVCVFVCWCFLMMAVCIIVACVTVFVYVWGLCVFEYKLSKFLSILGDGI